MKTLFIYIFFIQRIQAYSLHDLNNNEYTWEISGCHNAVIRAEPNAKYIVSSSFPNTYQSRMDCTWKVQAPLGKIVELTFPTFHVDFCDKAGVKIYDGPKSEATLAVEHCGLDNPPAFRSSGQMVQIQAYQQQASQGYGTLLMIGFQAVSKESLGNSARSGSTYYNNYSPQNSQISQNSLPNPRASLGAPNGIPNFMSNMNSLGMLNQYNLANMGPIVPIAPMTKAQPPRVVRTTKRPKKAQPKKHNSSNSKPKISLARQAGFTNASQDNIQRIREMKEEKKKKEAAALKQKLIIIIVILVVIISANIWFIWYRKSLERKIEDKKNKNSDQNSFTSKAPVLDNSDSLYCSLDDIKN